MKLSKLFYLLPYSIKYQNGKKKPGSKTTWRTKY